MQLVPGDVPGQAARGRGVAGDGAAPQPGLVRQRAEQGDGGAAGEGVVVEEVVQRQLLEVRAGDVVVLVEAGQRARVAAGDAQRAVGEDALVVDEMAEDFLERPLAGRVAEAGDGALVEAGEQLLHLALLRDQRGDRIVAGDAGDVGGGVLAELAGQRPAGLRYASHVRILAVLLLAATSALAQTAAPNADFDLVKVGDGVYAAVAKPGGIASGNAGFVIGDDGVVVIDNFFTPAAAGMLVAEIGKLTTKPIKLAVNTHYHLDHTGGLDRLRGQLADL